jgi:5,6-dimethylbenzimidazole synthase
MTEKGSTINGRFTAAECAAVYKAIFFRRDVRRFLTAPIAEEVIERILLAAHHAPSVGFMQPWNFIVIRNPDTKKSVKQAFVAAHAREAEDFMGARKELYLRLKLEGIEEAPLNICVTCDPTRHGPAVLGRSSNPRTDVYSTCCAIQNLWLAARAEGLGVGWVSIFSEKRLKEILHIPGHITVVGYLCVGYPERFDAQPELQTVGWLDRLPVRAVIFHEKWDEGAGAE